MSPGVCRQQQSTPRCDVLHIVWSGDPSGVTTQLAGLVRHAATTSTLSHRVCFLEGRGFVADALVHERIAFRLDMRRGWSPRSLLRFAHLLRRSSPGVVHFHVPAFGAIVVASAVAPQASLVWTQHDPGVLRPSVRFDIFYRLLRRRFDRFVVPTAVTAPALAARGVELSRIATIPYGLTMTPRPPEARWRANGATVGTVARLHVEKRLDLFVDIVAELDKRGVEATALIVGDGPERERLVKHAHDRGIGGRVSFVGEQQDVADWLDRMDVFVITSDVDTFPLAPLEAMARAVPVVAMPFPGGLAQVAARGGLLLADRDPASAAAALAELLASPDAREELGARGAAVAAEFSLDRALARLDALYAGLRAA